LDRREDAITMPHRKVLGLNLIGRMQERDAGHWLDLHACKEAGERTCMEACKLTQRRDDCGVLNGLLGMCGVGIRHLKKTEGVTE